MKKFHFPCFKAFTVLVLIALYGTPNLLMGQGSAYDYDLDSMLHMPDGKVRVGASVKLDGVYDFDGVLDASALNLTLIPLKSESDPFTTFFMNVRQSRIHVASANSFKRTGKVFGYLETDFLGANFTLRIRHAIVKYKKFLIGQTWSTFGDPDTWPRITDIEGPPTGVLQRQPMIRYKHILEENLILKVSLETPRLAVEQTLLDTGIIFQNQYVPDVIAHINKRYNTGHIQLAGIVRVINFRDLTENETAVGYGFNLTGQKIFKNGNRFLGQFVFGEGITRYLIAFDGALLDVNIDANGNLDLYSVIGGFVAYEVKWNKEKTLSSTFLGGFTSIGNDKIQMSDDFDSGFNVNVNLFYVPQPMFQFGIEGQYGWRNELSGESGDAFRIQFTAVYSF